jgi:hypothetical protein
MHGRREYGEQAAQRTTRVPSCGGCALALSSGTLRGTLQQESPREDTQPHLHVLGHDGDALGVDGAQVRVLEEALQEEEGESRSPGGVARSLRPHKQTHHEVRLSSLLQGEDRRALEAQICLVLLCKPAHEEVGWGGGIVKVSVHKI